MLSELIQAIPYPQALATAVVVLIALIAFLLGIRVLYTIAAKNFAIRRDSRIEAKRVRQAAEIALEDAEQDAARKRRRAARKEKEREAEHALKMARLKAEQCVPESEHRKQKADDDVYVSARDVEISANRSQVMANSHEEAELAAAAQPGSGKHRKGSGVTGGTASGGKADPQLDVAQLLSESDEAIFPEPNWWRKLLKRPSREELDYRRLIHKKTKTSHLRAVSLMETMISAGVPVPDHLMEMIKTLCASSSEFRDLRRTDSAEFTSQLALLFSGYMSILWTYRTAGAY